MFAIRRNGQTQTGDAGPAVEKPAAPEMLERLLAQAEQAGASDVHLQMNGALASISFRVDGVLAPIKQLPSESAERLIGRIKFLARLKTYQQSIPQHARIKNEVSGDE